MGDLEVSTAGLLMSVGRGIFFFFVSTLKNDTYILGHTERLDVLRVIT